jgi:hypothetical protein
MSSKTLSRFTITYLSAGIKAERNKPAYQQKKLTTTV